MPVRTNYFMFNRVQLPVRGFYLSKYIFRVAMKGVNEGSVGGCGWGGGDQHYLHSFTGIMTYSRGENLFWCVYLTTTRLLQFVISAFFLLIRND